MRSKELSEEEAYFALLEYAFNLVAKKRYTAAGLKKKLSDNIKKREGNWPIELLDKVLDRLLELKYLDDLQYAKDFVSDRLRFKPRGKMMLVQELRKAGVGKEVISEVFAGDFDESEAAKAVFEKNARKFDSKQKAFAFLMRKGFRQDVVYKVIKSCYNHSNDEDLEY